MTGTALYPVPDTSAHDAYINEETYHAWHARSLREPEQFWSEQAHEFITWFKPWDAVLTGDFEKLDVQWFKNAKLNAAYNCLDRHLEKKGTETAIIWQGDRIDEHKKITYAELHREVCQFANVLKKQGIQKGDRICIYLPMIPEAAIAMLASARIGAVHSVVFAGFSPDSLKTRILDADCRLVITANVGVRGNKIIPLKKNVDEAIAHCPNVSTVIVVKRTEQTTSWDRQKDIWYHEAMEQAPTECPCETMDADDPFYILYTSGSTGNPKGILHTLGGHLVYVAMTFKYIFNYQEGDVYWCTADVGWVTGHSYLIYGPLCNGATTLMFEGTPAYPTPARFWEIIDQYRVNIFYTAPTAIRALRREGDQWLQSTQRKSLKLLGTVGEPINPDVWEWFHQKVGLRRCPIVDTWWQTETGGIMISPLPGATPLKPGSACWPFFGVDAKIVDEKGNEVATNTMGKLVITRPWPGMMKTVYGDHDRFIETYFKDVPNAYLTGDNARIDEDHYFWITGRNDDVIKIAGHRIGTGEVESAFLTDPSVSEAGVVAVPDEIKGESIYAFIALKTGIQPNDALKNQLIQQVRHTIGAIATPRFIQWVDALPKTRSGKIMRRLLRKIANNDIDDLGDTSTLAEPEVVQALIKNRANTLPGKED